MEFLQDKGFFTDRPERVLALFMIVSVAVWTLQCTLLQNLLGVDTLEALTWGAQPVWGHTKHPPLSGWLAQFFSILSERRDWGLYFGCQVCMVTGIWFVYKTAAEFLPSYPATASAMLLYFLHYYTPGWMKFSTYFVEMALTPMIVYFFFTAVRHRELWRWLLLGLLCGLGILNKYSCGLILLALAAIFFLTPQYRCQLRSLKPWIAVLTGLLVLAPHLGWLWEHDFSCFAHVSKRMNDEHSRFMPLAVLAVAIYPPALEFLALTLAGGRRFLQWGRPVMTPLLRNILLLCLIPPLVYFVMSLLGSDIILMWFCTLAPWTGMAVVLLIPMAVNRQIFRNLLIMLIIYTIGWFIGTTADLLWRTSSGLHTRPQEIVNTAERFWREHRGDEAIPVTLGDRWFVTLMENYSEERIPGCELGDPQVLELHRGTICANGALLIGKSEGVFDEFLQEYKLPRPKFRKCTYRVKSLLGEELRYNFYLAVLPPPGDGPAFQRRMR